MTISVSESQPTSIELRRINDDHWVIYDNAFDAHDARHIVASVHEGDAGDVEVIWLRAGIPLSRRYLDAMEALEDFNRWIQQPRGGTRSMMIPRFVSSPRRLSRDRRRFGP